MDRRESATEIDDAAAKWVARLDHIDDAPEIRSDFETWLAGDPRRQGAYLRAEAAWRLLDRGRALGGLPLAENDDRSEEASQLPRRALIAGVGTLVAAFAGLAFLGLRPRIPVESYATQRGEIKRVPLADGSVAMLNTTTELDFALGADERLVTMRKGEGWFQVAKDRDRAFVVDAGFVRAIAVGTAFSVRRFADHAEVVVVEGVVRLSIDQDTLPGSLSPGDRAIVDQSGHVRLATLSDKDIRRQLAWRDGGLGLDGETIAAAAAEFNRYNRLQIVVEPGPLGAERIVGWFDVNDPIGFAQSASLAYGGRVDIEGNVIHLRPGKEK